MKGKGREGAPLHLVPNFLAAAAVVRDAHPELRPYLARAALHRAPSHDRMIRAGSPCEPSRVQAAALLLLPRPLPYLAR